MISTPSIHLPRKRFLLVARYYSIEPLGILYLAGVVRDAGWECKVELVHEFDFAPLYETVRMWKPDLVGFQIWTGYHTHAFAACDAVRAMGVPVVIGGPHATYNTAACLAHGDWVVQGMGFRLFGDLLAGTLSRGAHFDKKGREDPFPLPDRDVVYSEYPALGRSPIKSMFASVGCPFHCSYCYAPAFNDMHGGFKFITSSIDRLIAEVHALRERWPVSMVYFQDDVFGFEYKRWLPEFARRWSGEVGLPFHCQVRLELVEGPAGERRLDLFQEAGCTGITLAIESGNEFLRDRVLMRSMQDELIVEGCRKIMEQGLTLRTEQILAVPFSDTATDLSTLDLNNRINPTMAWTSILAPYQGTNMGTIATNLGLYHGNNDDLADTFFDRSVLTHVAGGPRDIERIVSALGINPKAQPKEQPLVHMSARKGTPASNVHYKDEHVGTIEHLGEAENERYCEDTVRLQRLFNFLAKVPDAKHLGKMLVDVVPDAWSWETIGEATFRHLLSHHGYDELKRREHILAREMGVEHLPDPIAQNPHYFCYFAAGGKLARKALEAQVFDRGSTASVLDEVNTLTRRHLFEHELYKIEFGADPIAA